jgi:hypothetical protein
VLVYGATILTRVPVPYSDEGWVGAFAWSVASGHGRREPLMVGSRIYDHVDQWTSVIGTLPFDAAQLLAGPSLAAYRAASYALGVAALLLLIIALRRYGTGNALAIATLLASSWAFVATTHWVRWDATAVALVAAVLALLSRNSIGVASAAAVGALLVVGLDVEPAAIALAPGALIILAWDPYGRRRRLSVFAATALFVGMGYAALRLLPSPTIARAQFRDVYAAGPYHLPLGQLLGGDLSSATDELDRYRAMEFGQSALYSTVGTLVLFEAGIAAAVVLVVGSARHLAARVVPGVLLIGYILALGLIQGNRGATYVWYAAPLVVASLAAVLFSDPGSTRRERVALGAVALLGASLAGGALLSHSGASFVAAVVVLAGIWIARNRFEPLIATTVVAVALCAVNVLVAASGHLAWHEAVAAAPFSLLAGATACRGRWSNLVQPAVVLASAGLLTMVLVRDASRIPASPIQSHALRSAAARMVGPNDTVMGEWQWWYLFGHGRYRANSTIWLQRYAYGSSFAAAFAHVCPSVVLLDASWVNRYAVARYTAFPSLAPTDEAELPELHAYLRQNYRVADNVVVDGDTFTFWRRRAAVCLAQA